MSRFSDLVNELKSRNVRKTMAIYISSALTTAGVVKLFTEVYDLPAAVFNIVVVFLTSGIVSAFVFAWHHGTAGSQRIQKREILCHSLVAVAAIILSFRVMGTHRPLQFSSNAKVIAVLPFKNMSESKEDEFFSDGVTEDILTHLSKIGDLKVISRTSVMKYKNTDKSIREIGHELDAGSILEGSVRRIGNRVRIVGQLINATTDEHVWAETYDREFKDVFAIQTEVAREIARALSARLSLDEQKRIDKKATTNLDAYTYYLRGRDYYYRLSKEENEQAIEFFRKAIAFDSSYALAFAGLADAYAQRYQRYGFDERWIDSSVALSTHAIELDPDIPEPYKSLGLAYYQKEWYGKAMEQYRIALELNPNFASVYSNMGELLDWTGRPDEAIPLIKKAMKLQPGRTSDYVKLSSAYYSLGLDSISLELILKAIELQPSYTTSYVNLADIYAGQDSIAKERSLLDSMLTIHPDDLILSFAAGNVELSDRNYERAQKIFRRIYDSSPDYFGLLAPLGFALLKSGRTAEGNKILDLSVQSNLKAIENLSEEGHRRYDLARVFAIRKDTASALKWLKEALGRNSGFYTFALSDPLMESLHENSMFKQLMELHRQRIEAMRDRVRRQEGTV